MTVQPPKNGKGARECAESALLRPTLRGGVLVTKQEARKLAEAVIAMDDLLRRLSEWDVLYVSPEGKPSTADAPYWQAEIAKVRRV